MEKNISISGSTTSFHGNKVSSKYPLCEVEIPEFVGDGKCDNYGGYNKAECGFDGGDCIIFNAKYPHCNATYPSLIGDGECQNVFPYYTKDCGWDEKDCSTIVSVWIIFIGIAYIMLPLFVLESRRRMRSVENSLRNHQEVIDDETGHFQKERRREFVLKNIIHKKLVHRASKSSFESTQHKEKVSGINEENLQSCIPVNSRETLNSIRNSSDSVAYIDKSISPLVCSICFEDYEKNDYISLSKNERCHHVYHVDCILQWLMDNDDCPMCRCKYVHVNELVTSCILDVEEGPNVEVFNDENLQTEVERTSQSPTDGLAV